MPSLEARIAALEVETSTAEPLTIIRRFVRPGQPPTELQALRDSKGTEWRRVPGESEKGLIDRASIEAWRNLCGVASLESFFEQVWRKHPADNRPSTNKNEEQ
jgi:hypothetical protein